MLIEECTVKSVECGVGSVNKVRSVSFRLSVKCKSVECRVRSLRRGVWSVKSKGWSVKSKVLSVQSLM